MADNTRGGSSSGSDPLIATDEVTYSGDTADIQLTRIVAVTGSEGSKTVVENMPASLGQKAMAASFPVVLPSDQTNPVVGNIASGSADSGNPVKVGGVAIDFEAMPADVTIGDRVDAAYTPKGIAAVALFNSETSQAVTTLPVTISGGGEVSITASVLPTGAATAAKQPALGTAGTSSADVITVQGRASMTPVLVDGSATTQPVSAASLPLPTGAATSANQTTEITSLQLLDDLVIAEDAAHANGDKGIVALAVRRDTATSSTATDGDYGTLTTDTAGRLRTSAADTTQPVSGTFWQATQPVSIATAPVLVAGSALIGKVGIDQTTPGTTNAVSAVLTTGSAAIGKLAANSGVDIGDTDVTSIIPGTGATNLGKAVDSAGASTDTGVAALGLREDALVVVTPADGDYTRMKMDPLGKQWVNTGLSPELYISKSFNATTTQTGIDVWDPAGGKKIAVSSVVIGTYGTTAARVILWFGDNADTTYSAGTDQLLLAASFAPSATASPGLVFTPAQPVICNTADRELHITTSAGISIDVAVHGWEF